MSAANPLVQYVIVRGDLLYALKWPIGAVLAQACHVCTAVTHLFYHDPHTQEYVADIDNMRKIVLEVIMLFFLIKSLKCFSFYI